LAKFAAPRASLVGTPPASSSHCTRSTRCGLDWIERIAGDLRGKRVVDIGCWRRDSLRSHGREGRARLGIDLSDKALGVARLHKLESGTNVEYRLVAAETLRRGIARCFDVVTSWKCWSMCRARRSIVAAARSSLNPPALWCFPTLNRNPKSYLLAVIRRRIHSRLAAERHA
jgi:2-polyprenyl-6-hydroxyphenyl methylase/3-demethylubiquinone-9 3-methyltransferase